MSDTSGETVRANKQDTQESNIRNADNTDIRSPDISVTLTMIRDEQQGLRGSPPGREIFPQSTGRLRGQKGRQSHGYQGLFPREQTRWKLQLAAHIYPVPGLGISGAKIWSINKITYNWKWHQ